MTNKNALLPDFLSLRSYQLRQFIKEYTPAATIVWADFTKCGTVQQDTLDEVTEEIRRICAAYPNKSCAVVIAPAMTSARVVAGKRGEMRQGCYIEQCSGSIINDLPAMYCSLSGGWKTSWMRNA